MPLHPTGSTQPAVKVARANPQPIHAAQIPEALLKLKTAGAIAGLSEATLYRKAKSDPTFPPLIKLGARCTRIRAGDWMKWLAAQGTSSVKVA